MKKLTKRNRTHNRKDVFGYHAECGPDQMSNYTTRVTFDWWRMTWSYSCEYSPGSCCDV